MISFRLVHGNLSAENILITENYQVKITDFSCSRYYKEDPFKIMQYLNEIDIDYQPAEFFKNNYLDWRDIHKIDLFSLGCVFI